MKEPMEAAIRHAKFLAKYLNKCNNKYIIQLALKEIGVPSYHDGFQFAKNAVVMLCENPFYTLRNCVYLAVGQLRIPPAGQDQVEQSIRFGVRTAWKSRGKEIWECYFHDGCSGSVSCPSNREFLMAVVDFVELWNACCEEVRYESEV